MAKKVKNETALDKVVDYLLENMENPHNIFKSNTKENNLFHQFPKKIT